MVPFLEEKKEKREEEEEEKIWGANMYGDISTCEKLLASVVCRQQP